LYAIVDIETTGLSPRNEKITEIAIFIHDGTKVIDEFTSLVNPERKIPYRITQLTGINNKMVDSAPKFYEIAKKIIEITEGAIFVGHNVSFDYNFVRKEFSEFEYDYKREKLCTAKLSRRLLPGRRSYALGKISKELGIENPHRHRAYGDAQATVKLFEILLKVEKNLKELSLKGLNTSLDRTLIDNLPQKPGVYYFHNDEGEIIYIGKSINIHDRVMSHLSNNATKKAIEMRNQISDITFEICGNELIALLHESNEIKKHMPRFNRAQRRANTQWGIFESIDQNGYRRLKIDHNDKEEVPLTTFSSSLNAKNHLFMLTEAFNLCQKLCGLFDTKNACFQYNIKQCKGACIGEEKPEDYNQRFAQAITPYHFHHNSFILVDKGRNSEEKSLVWVDHGKYIGFGYIQSNEVQINSNDDLKSFIHHYPDNRDVQHLIKAYLKNHKVERTIVL
jgi:DNA polymerase-3 subunit epsilon